MNIVTNQFANNCDLQLLILMTILFLNVSRSDALKCNWVQRHSDSKPGGDFDLNKKT